MGAKVLCVIHLLVNLTLVFVIKVLTVGVDGSQSVIPLEGVQEKLMDFPSVVQCFEGDATILREPVDTLVPNEVDESWVNR